MPYICITTNVTVDNKTKMKLEKSLGSVISTLPGKSERWLMSAVKDSVIMTLGGTDSPLAMVSVALYGKAPREAYNTLTKELTALVSEKLDIHPTRIYVSYTEHEVFGWNGCNF